MQESYLVTVLGSAAFLSFMIEALKKAPWFPFLNLNTSKLNAWASVVLAVISGLGITYAWDETTRNLTLHLPTFFAMLSAVWHICIQWAFQKGAYHAFVQTPQPVTLERKVTTDKPPAEAGAVF